MRNAFAFRVLRLEKSKIADSGLAALGAWKNLEFIDLESTDIGDAGLKNLSALPKLRRVWLSRVHITDAGIPGTRATDATGRAWHQRNRHYGGRLRIALAAALPKAKIGWSPRPTGPPPVVN